MGLLRWIDQLFFFLLNYTGIVLLVLLVAVNMAERFRERGNERVAKMWAVPAFALLGIGYLYLALKLNNVVIVLFLVLGLLPLVLRGKLRIALCTTANYVHLFAWLACMFLFMEFYFVVFVIGVKALDMSNISYTSQLLYKLLELVIAFIGIGFLTRRKFRDALERLKIVCPTWKQVGLACLLAGGAFFLFGWIDKLSDYLGWSNPEVNEVYGELLNVIAPTTFIAVISSITAGISEEAIFRGALQPRFGIIFTAFLFTITHVHYGISIALLTLFLFGLLAGWLRIRYNTTTAMIFHAVFDILALCVVF